MKNLIKIIYLVYTQGQNGPDGDGQNERNIVRCYDVLYLYLYFRKKIMR